MKRSEAQEYVKNHLKDYLIYQGINPDKQFHCLNPSHNDNNPSMGYVDNTSPAVHCLSCGATYDTFDVIGIFNNVDSFKEKEKLAYEFFNISIDEPFRKPLTTEEQKNDRLKNAMKEAVEVTRNSLKSDEEFAKRSRDYLAHRKISQETIDKFRIGVEFDNKIPSHLINQLHYKKSELLEANLMRTTAFGDKDTFYNRIVIPICDEYGNPLGFGGRSIEDKPKIKYLNTSDTPIFKKGDILFNYHLAKSNAIDNEIVLVEGYFDVISAWEMGMKNVVASMGVGLQDNQIKLIQKLNCEVIVCLDNPLIDEAGKNAMLRIIPQLINNGLVVSAYDTALLGDKVKDFGDFCENNISIDKIKATKIPGLHFLLKYKYFNDKKIDVDTIANVYNQLQDIKLIKNTRDEIQYKEFLIKNSSFSKQEIEDIIHPKEVAKVDNIVNQIAQGFFYNDIKHRISSYAMKSNDKVLLKMIDDNKITSTFFFKGISNHIGIKMKDGKIDKFNVEDYIKEYIIPSNEYQETQQMQIEEDRKLRLKEMPDILDNVYGFDKNGNEVRIWLTDEQKEVVVQQYKASFMEETRQKHKLPQNVMNYTKLFIADNEEEFKRLWLGVNMVDAHRWYYEYFSIGKMAAVPYATCFRTVPNVDAKKLSNEYVVKVGDEYHFKTLFVFNNKDGLLKLSPENYINPSERTKEQHNIPQKKINVDKKMSEKQTKDINKAQYSNEEEIIKDVGKDNILSIPLKEGQYLTTSYGIYIVNPSSPKTAIYIDNKSYTNNGTDINISIANRKPMSIYNLKEEGDLSIHSRKYVSRLEKEDFINNYQSMYTISNNQNNDEPIVNEPKEMVS